MSQLALQSEEDPLDSYHNHLRQQAVKSKSASKPPNSSVQDSPTIGRVQTSSGSDSYSSLSISTGALPGPAPSPTTSASSRSQRRHPIPSPLHTTTAISPPSSASSTRSVFPSPLLYESYTTAVPQIVTTAVAAEGDATPSIGKTYYDSDSSSPVTPGERSPRLLISSATPPIPFAESPRFPNESRSASDPVVVSKSRGVPFPVLPAAMAGPTSPTTVSMPQAPGAPRNSSMDSAISAISTKSASAKGQPVSAETTDIAHLIKTAGSPEAVIQYLLKDKISQSQQNAQLWRLVDKQRAMILGLNKDLERALKDKEKYRKKLKEVIVLADIPPLPAGSSQSSSAQATPVLSIATSVSKEQVLNMPISPVLDSDSQKHSPVDVSLAPYPITPPADQPSHNGPPSAVGEILDPSHSMPKASEHALDQFDHEAQERDAELARKRTDKAKDLHIDFGLPPSRSLPSEPPRIPPPQPPASTPPVASPILDDGIAQFPAPPAPPPRKPPPAPLQLRKTQQSPTVPVADDVETDSDYDDILEVDEITADERRGRRRTREEDQEDREIVIQQLAEKRSLSKKSKTSNSQPGSPTAANAPPSPRANQAMAPRDNVSSLAGVLKGDTLALPETSGPLLSPGLPASPRPMSTMKTPVTSPPLSPLGVSNFPGQPLSPRPPRQPIPLPPNTPLQTPSPPVTIDGLNLTSPKPLNIVKKSTESVSTLSPTTSTREIPSERTKVYRGFTTEEYPDLLLPPNALPSVDIKVASSRMKPSRASLLSLTQLEEDPVFTLAIFSRADGGELWRVEKDTTSLAKLDSRLKQCAAFTAKTPDRSLFTGHAPAKLDARRIALNQYLDELLNTPLDTAAAVELCKWLSHNTLPPNADETGSVVMAPEVPRFGPGGRPFRSGYLTKRGKNFGGWKARFFVLESAHLKYYETPGGAHLGTIKLQKAQIGKQSAPQTNEGSPARTPGPDDMDNQYRHAFLILEPKKKDPSSVTKHVLCAESDDERDNWVDALLRWIDYKDPEDEDHKDSKKDHIHGRQGSGGSSSTNGKKKHGHKQLHNHPADSEETLIGMSYDSAKQGDAPQGAPSKSRHAGPHDHGHEPGQQTMYSISGPRDPQVISGSDGWPSKLSMSTAPPAGLAPPSQEEKKARKRSFFGFGPKVRTSGEANDSLFGSDNGNAPSAQVGNQYNGPVRQVFGANLAEAVRYNSPVDVRVPLPAVVYRCIQYLDAKNAINEEGIFRLSGSNVVIKALRERFNNESDVNLLADEEYHDIHAIASLLKLYLRELPTTILTRDLHLEFLSITELTDIREKTAGLNELVQRLPQANATLLKYLIAFLIKIISSADSNKMTVRNVGIVFSPTLNIPAPVFAMFLQHYEPIFGIKPQEYELPFPVAENHGRRPSLPNDRPPVGERRPSDNQRPATASGSPHRQRLMEAMKEGQQARGSPTPPPIVNMQHMAQMNAMRSTPTPPPQRQMQHQYDPSFLAQQSTQSNRMSLRPAYEGNLYDPTQMRSNPGYDRQVYDNGQGQAPYEQPHGRQNRRESMVMGNLQHQTSRSRLRDDGY